METQPVHTIDLTRVRARLLRSGWDAARYAAAEASYLAFLGDAGAGDVLTPTPDVDEVWHAHLLHTKDYLRDCMRVFGRFLHHEPSEHVDGVAKCDSCNVNCSPQKCASRCSCHLNCRPAAQ